MLNFILTDTGTQVLEIIKTSGGQWISNVEIAEKLGYNPPRLRADDLEVLKFLALNHVIESKVVDWKWVHRMVN